MATSPQQGWPDSSPPPAAETFEKLAFDLTIRKLVEAFGYPKVGRAWQAALLQTCQAQAAAHRHWAKCWSLLQHATTLPEVVAVLIHSCCRLQQILTWDFDWRYMVRGLVIDKKRGNMLKIDRHKYVKLAYHGFKRMSREQRRDIYSNNAVPYAWPATKCCCYRVLPGCLRLQPLHGEVLHGCSA